MQRNIVITLAIVSLTACNGIEEAVNQLTDALENGQGDRCLARQNEDEGEEDGEDVYATTECDGTDAGESDVAAEDSSGDVNDTDSESSDGQASDDEVAHVFEMDGAGGVRYFMGTFEKSPSYYDCPDWPTIVRLYSEDDMVDFVDNRGELIARGPIFQDYTWDFQATYQDMFGRDNGDLACTCTYSDYHAYNDIVDCACEFENGDTCTLEYHSQGGYM